MISLVLTTASNSQHIIN